MGDKDDVKQNTEIKDTDLLSVRHLAKQSTFDLVFLSLTYKSSFPARYTVTLSHNWIGMVAHTLSCFFSVFYNLRHCVYLKHL